MEKIYFSGLNKLNIKINCKYIFYLEIIGINMRIFRN